MVKATQHNSRRGRSRRGAAPPPPRASAGASVSVFSVPRRCTIENDSRNCESTRCGNLATRARARESGRRVDPPGVNSVRRGAKVCPGGPGTSRIRSNFDKLVSDQFEQNWPTWPKRPTSSNFESWTNMKPTKIGPKSVTCDTNSPRFRTKWAKCDQRLLDIDQKSPEVDQSWPEFEQMLPEVGQLPPELTQKRPNLRRPSWGRRRPNLVHLGWLNDDVLEASAIGTLPMSVLAAAGVARGKACSSAGGCARAGAWVCIDHSFT